MATISQKTQQHGIDTSSGYKRHAKCVGEAVSASMIVVDELCDRLKLEATLKRVSHFAIVFTADRIFEKARFDLVVFDLVVVA